MPQEPEEAGSRDETFSSRLLTLVRHVGKLETGSFINAITSAKGACVIVTINPLFIHSLPQYTQGRVSSSGGRTANKPKPQVTWFQNSLDAHVGLGKSSVIIFNH